MDEILGQVLNLGTLVLAMTVVIITFFVKRIVETAAPSIKKQADENSPQATYKTQLARWWNEVILHLIPELLGAIIGIFPNEFLYGTTVKTMSGRMFYGIVTAWFSSSLYKIVRKAIAAKAGVELPDVDLDKE